MNKWGKEGEEVASIYLKSKGHEIMNRNFRTRIGEIDIITAHNGYIVFIEVKIRRNDEYGTPLESINSHKIKRINQVASQYINKFRLFECDIRFDIIEINLIDGSINHIENAFESLLSL